MPTVKQEKIRILCRDMTREQLEILCPEVLGCCLRRKFTLETVIQVPCEAAEAAYLLSAILGDFSVSTPFTIREVLDRVFNTPS
ncbi:MAG TPA: hypothetical protein VJB37_01255 [Patescibacteria group bacterium]|nr:hypothetical protein [Patescibacteria group bacterium]